MSMRNTRPYEKYGRRRSGRSGRLTGFLVMLAAVCALVLLVRSRMFVISEIEVTGNSAKSASEIAGLSGLRLGMNIFSVKKDEIERNISRDNYVELLNVDIEMPDKVTLEVRERTACAAVNCAGVILVIDEDGFILERRANVPDGNLVIISGMNISAGAQARRIESNTPGQTDTACRVLDAIRTAQVQGLVSELNVSDQENLYLVSQSGIQVLLGDDTQLEEKLDWMQAVLQKLTRAGIMRGILDVSSGTNAAFTEF